jgi:hypothetical protein
MAPFIKALEMVARVMRDGAAKQIMSGAPNNICASAGRRSEDHVSHAAMRLLMALILRELESFARRSSVCHGPGILCACRPFDDHRNNRGGEQIFEIEIDARGFLPVAFPRIGSRL